MSPRRCCAKDCFNSQMNTKDVFYFRFPKSEYYARQWAIAAGRMDLMNKPLHLVIKYYLCSEHFSDDCFQDPPIKAILKKSIRPVKAPIPTIFRNNITKFLPNCLQAQDQKSPHDEDRALRDLLSSEDTTTILVIPEPLARLSQEEEANISACEPQGKMLNLLGSNEEAVEPTLEYDEETDGELCRLCASRCAMEDLICIFANETIAQTVDLLLPGVVKKEDETLSQYVCGECLDKANQCAEIIYEFRAAQTIQSNSLNKS